MKTSARQGFADLVHAFAMAMYCVVQLARYAESSLGARHSSRMAAWPGNAMRRLLSPTPVSASSTRLATSVKL